MKQSKQYKNIYKCSFKTTKKNISSRIKKILSLWQKSLKHRPCLPLLKKDHSVMNDDGELFLKNLINYRDGFISPIDQSFLKDMFIFWSNNFKHEKWSVQNLGTIENVFIEYLWMKPPYIDKVYKYKDNNNKTRLKPFWRFDIEKQIDEKTIMCYQIWMTSSQLVNGKDAYKIFETVLKF
jgi:hypothetical protein